jgi:hypothetical protein
MKNMKKIYFTIVFFLLILFCLGQNSQKSIDFSIYLKHPHSINLKNCYLSEGYNLYITYMRRGFSKTPKSGQGTLFAIPKKEYKTWGVTNSEGWKRAELVKENQEKQELKKELLANRDTLLKYFELYVFYVRQSDLFVALQEIDDNGKMTDAYDIKAGALVYTYKYENNTWAEKRKEDIGDEVTGTYGAAVVGEILKERFGKAIVQ